MLKQKITKLLVDALKIGLKGVVALIGNKDEVFEGIYSPCSDGRMEICCDAWAAFAAFNGFKAGHTVMSCFCFIHMKKIWCRQGLSRSPSMPFETMFQQNQLYMAHI